MFIVFMKQNVNNAYWKQFVFFASARFQNERLYSFSERRFLQKDDEFVDKVANKFPAFCKRHNKAQPHAPNRQQ